jgi:hypothetical protein
MVGDCNFLALNEENALVGIGPHFIQTLDMVLSTQLNVVAGLGKVIVRVHGHHVWGKYFLISTCDFQVSVSTVGHEQKPVPGVCCCF